MADSKVFDVAHPKTDDSSAQAVRTPRKIMLNEPVLEQGTSATPEIEESSEVVDKNPISRTGTKVTPRSENITPDSGTAPELDSLVEVSAEPKSEEPAKPELDEVAIVEVAEPVVEKVEPVKDLSSIDSILPDTSQRATAVAKDAMQSPTMFDTKAYYVPIGNSQHKHGHVLGSVIAGIITAAVVAGGIYLLAKLT